ncbi:MAG: ferritin-like domain-containing protein [Planctomycetia bacterium]|nr:ferritin-like domain-containing protein [Planctomycetia bacterium]
MDKTKMVSKLNEILAHEWTGVAQYSQQGFMVQGLWREAYEPRFKAGADESFAHARLIGDKIVALGGVPTIERNKVKQADSIEEMLANSLQFEQTAVRHYEEALALCDDETDRPLVILLEDILLQEQAGADELVKLVHGAQAASPAQPAKPARARVG